MADMTSASGAGFLPTNSQLVRQDTTTPSVDDYANVFGPTAYNIIPDVNRNRKYSRLHIPDVLKVVSRIYTHAFSHAVEFLFFF